MVKVTDKKDKKRWPAMVVLFGLLALATYIMMQNPNHKAAQLTNMQQQEAAFDSVSERIDTMRADSVVRRRTRKVSTHTPKPPAPNRDILSEAIPTQ